MSCKLSRHYSLYFAWLIALVATLVSLYFSEIVHWPVCHLCWYQRICIYPLVIILGIATYREDHRIATYAIPLAVIGLFFSAYQYAQQMIPAFAPIDFCGTTGPDCSHIHFKLWGFITFPFLSIVACVVIILLLIMASLCRKCSP